MKQTLILQELMQSNVFEGNLILTPIEGGTINQSFLLKNMDSSYFLKTFELNHFTPCDRQAIYILQSQLAQLHRAPKPYYLAKNHDFQVEEWVEHHSLPKTSLSREEKIRVLAKTLYEIHELPTYAISLDLQSDWKMYMEKAAIKPSPELTERITHCKEVWIESLQHDQVLCHNDLAMEHIAMGEHAVVFDWEYAAYGSRYFDIAACAQINKLSPGETRQLQHDYSEFSLLPFQDIVEQTTAQFPLVELTNELWYQAVGMIEHA